LARVQGVLDATAQELRVAGSELVTVIERREALEAELADSQEARERLQSQVRELIAARESLSQDVATLRQQQSEAATQRQQLETSLEHRVEELARVQGDLDATTQKLQVAGSKVVSLDQRGAALEAELADSREAQGQLRSQVQE
jgi:chromosome segregation ATPase